MFDDAIPWRIATAEDKIPLYCSSLAGGANGEIALTKTWSGERVAHPDADPEIYADEAFFFTRIS